MLAVVIFSGFRLGLGSIAIGTFLLMFFKKKWLFASGVTTGYFLIQYIVISYSSVIYTTVTRQIGLENPLMRLMGIFAIFDPTIPDEYKLSMTRSISLSEELFENPFFGKATQYLVGQYDSITDAYLALHIIDLGFIGFFILLLPYIYTLKIVRKNCIRKAFFVMVIYFVVAIVQMLVDQGLFSQNKSHLFFCFQAFVSISLGRTDLKNMKNP